MAISFMSLLQKSTSELERLVLQHNPEGVIYTRQLLTLLDSIEQSCGHALLISPQKAAIEPYCKANPNVEMTTSDIVALLTLVPHQLHNSDQVRTFSWSSSCPPLKRHCIH